MVERRIQKMAGLLSILLVILEIPIMLIIIAVSNAKKNKVAKEARKAFKGKYAEYFESAKKMANMGEYKLSLAALRNSLEALIKYLCGRYGIPTGLEDTSLLTLIDRLYAGNAITVSQKNLMHEIRMASNKGSHVALNEIPVTSSDAYGAIMKMDNLLTSMYETHKNLVPGMFD